MEPQNPLPRLPSSLAADFVLERELATGGMGVIYVAQQLSQGRRVALKFIAPDLVTDEETRARFLAESQVTSKLQHPNIVEVHASGADGNVLYIVYQYLEGTNLKDLMRQGGLPPERVLPLMAQVARAIAFAHGKKVLHRDIKPENIILLRGREEVKVIDFGIAYESGRKTLTQAGLIMGTPEYVAPEQAVGNRPTELSDQYALGVTLYEVLSGRLPIEDSNTIDLFTKKIRGQIVPLRERVPSLHPAILACIDRTLAVDPRRRYPSVAALADELERLRTISTIRRPGAAAASNPGSRASATLSFDGSSPLLASLQTTKSAVLAPVKRLLPTLVRQRLGERLQTHGPLIALIALVLSALVGIRSIVLRVTAIPPPDFSGMSASASLDGLIVRWPSSHPGPAVARWWVAQPKGEIHEVAMHKDIRGWQATLPVSDESAVLCVQVAVPAASPPANASAPMEVQSPRGKLRALALGLSRLDLGALYAAGESAPASGQTADGQRQALAHDLAFTLKRYARVIEDAHDLTGTVSAQDQSIVAQAFSRPDIDADTKGKLLSGLSRLALLDQAVAVLGPVAPDALSPGLRSVVDALVQWHFIGMHASRALPDSSPALELMVGENEGRTFNVTVPENPTASEAICNLILSGGNHMGAATLELVWPGRRLDLTLVAPAPENGYELHGCDPWRGGATLRLDKSLIASGSMQVIVHPVSLRGLCPGDAGFRVESVRLERPVVSAR